jgi:hypothetical protein
MALALYRRADWDWARDGGPTLTHGWRPESGFLPYRWEGYDEGLLLYVLGLGSPTYPLPPESYTAFCATYQWKEIAGMAQTHAGLGDGSMKPSRDRTSGRKLYEAGRDRVIIR